MYSLKLSIGSLKNHTFFFYNNFINFLSMIELILFFIKTNATLVFNCIYKNVKFFLESV